jgi:type VI secretion system protein ImpK
VVAFAQGKGEQSAPTPASEVARLVAGQLVQALERQSLAFSLSGGEMGARLLPSVMYVMVAYADDVLLSFPWAGRAEWVRNPLETRMFGSQRAGEAIFRTIAGNFEMIDFGRRELAQAYLAALSLGFQGRYRGSDEAPHVLADYRRKLFLLAYGREPRAEQGAATVVQDVYRHTVSGGVAQKMRYLRPWLIAAGAVAVAYMIGSSTIWIVRTQALSEVVAMALISMSDKP